MDAHTLVRVEDSELSERNTFGVGLWVNHANDPVVFRYGEDELPLLGHVTTGDLTAYYSLGVARFGFDLPLHTFADGFGVDRPTNFGDLRLSTKASLLSRASSPVGVGLYADATLPTAGQSSWVGAGVTRVTAGATASTQLAPVLLVANAGFATGSGEQLADLVFAPALAWGLGASAQIIDQLALSAELDGELWLNNAGAPGRAPIEWLAAAHVMPASHLVATLGAGTGLTQGLGTPDLRLVGSVRWSPGPAKPVIDEDPDGDGILGDADRCPTVAEDFDGVEDTDGCPDADPQADTGKLTIRAVRPGGQPVPRAEVRVLGTLGQQLVTGSDGILEASLAADTYEVIVTAPGWVAATRTAKVEPDGAVDLTVVLMPEVVTVDREAGQIYLNKKVYFELDKAELKVESLQVLDDLVAVLLANPDVLKVRIEGHTDTQGSESHNLELSDERAQTVAAYLVKSGIDAARVVAKGYGESRPLQQGDSDDVHAANRRVEFHIVEIADQE